MGKRLITQRRARGNSLYRSPSHRHVADIRLPAMAEGVATVKDLIQAPGRTCPLAVLDIDGKTNYQLAVEGTKVGQKLIIGGHDVVAGNITLLSKIPEGTPLHNVEARPGDGGKYIKTAGSSGTVVSRGDKVMVLMPSGVNKEFSPDCRAVIGVVAGGGRGDKPLAKAGKNVLTLRSRSKAPFKTKGVAMNPVDHPHGGGSHAHVGGPNCQKRTASPGQKVGFLPPKKKVKK